MSGPSYPRPVPGSNAIGSFIIGVSPIGDITPFDVWTTVISQYANSPILDSLIVNFSQYIDQTVNLQAFYDMIWNVDSAQGYGLDVWGRIVGVSRILQIPTTDEYFGFEEATDRFPFNQAPFYAGAPLTSNYRLSDSAYRTLIFAKALANISDGSLPSINQLLINVFGTSQGNCYVADNLNMTMTYVFDFFLDPVQLAIIQNSGVFPKPAGVSTTIQQGI